MRCHSLRAVTAPLLVVSVLGAPQCAEYAARGYCSDAKYEKYMSRHCPDVCGSAALQEDEACANWASEGYCQHPQFVEYMERSCPRACGFPVPPSGTPAAGGDAGEASGAGEADASAAVEVAEEEEEYGEEAEDEAPPTAAPKWGGGQQAA